MALGKVRDSIHLLDRIAQLADTDCGAEILGILQILQQTVDETKPDIHLTKASAPSKSAPTGQVGIWQAAEGDATRFVRLESARASWRSYADVEEFVVEAGKRHVVLVGESAPRGYLYDPAITPAQILQAALHHCEGLDDCKVIDLASTGALLPDLLRLIDDAAKLKPEAIVVFAGNNWQAAKDVPAEDRQRVAMIMREEGATAARNWLLRYKTESSVGELRKRLLELSAATQIRFVIVIPEFNIADWNTYHEPLLPDDQLQEWRKLHASAQMALHDCEFERARGFALAMVELDQGASEFAFAVLERCDLEDGAVAACHRNRQLKRDAACGRWVDQTPRCPTPLQDALREMAFRENHECVDLPNILRNETGGLGPGRDWFLDYCHLNLRGIRLAMAHLGIVLARLFGAAPPEVRELLEVKQVAADVEAIAHFLAAVHASHYGQAEGLIRYHCDQAIAKDPATATSLMAAYERCTGSGGPTWMSRGYRDLIARRQVARYLGPRDASVHQKRDEIPLFEIFHRACDTASSIAASSLSAGQSDHDVIGEGWIDLLSEKRVGGDQQGFLFGSVGPWRSFYCQKTRHRFSLGEVAPLQFELTMRLPKATLLNEADVEVLINRQFHCSLSISRSWQTLIFEVESSKLTRGLNMIELVLPAPRTNYGEECKRIAREIQLLGTPRVEQAWGQIFSFGLKSAPGQASAAGHVAAAAKHSKTVLN